VVTNRLKVDSGKAAPVGTCDGHFFAPNENKPLKNVGFFRREAERSFLGVRDQ
jgi:hypothetical protein